MPIFRLFQVAVLTAALFTGALPAYAQSNKPVRSGTWYEDRASGSNVVVMNLTFAQAPLDKLLNITRVACDIMLSPGLVLGRVVLNGGTTSGTGDLGRPQTVRGNAIPEISSNSKLYSIVTDTYLKLGPGRYPIVAVYPFAGPSGAGASPFATADCVIVGNLSDN